MKLNDNEMQMIIDGVASKLGDQALIRARLDTYYKEGEEKAQRFAKQIMSTSSSGKLRAILDSKLEDAKSSILRDLQRDLLVSDDFRDLIRNEIKSLMLEAFNERS